MDALTLQELKGISVLPIGIETVLVRVALSFVLGMLIALTYRRTHKAFAYSYSMVTSIVMIAMIVSMVLMVIDNSLARAFGLVGALSIIRFRTPVKDMKDMIYLFSAIAAGIAVGAGAYLVAVICVFATLVVSYMMFYVKFGQKQTDELLIKLFAGRAPIDEGKSDYEALLEQDCRSYSLIEMNANKDGATELVYSIKLLDASKIRDIVRRLTQDHNIERVSVLSAIHNLDVQ